MNFLTRSLSKVYNIVTGRGCPSVEKDMDEIMELLTACVEQKGGEVSARMRAAEMVRYYLILDDAGRRQVLNLIATRFGPSHDEIARAHAAYQQSISTEGQWAAENTLRIALESPRKRILTQFNTINIGVCFLVELRSDLLRYMKDDPELAALDGDLKSCLTSWFDVGFLELRRITWDSSASVLEKLIAYEAVHEINSWSDLKNRLDSDRRCYAFFHPHMPDDPLIFVQVALVKDMSGDVQQLLDVDAPVYDPAQAEAAVFYSITNTQKGLRGISFGSFLLKRVINSLTGDFPKLKTFATLSPLPGFMSWFKNNKTALVNACTSGDIKRLAEAGADEAAFEEIINNPESFQPNSALLDALREPMMRVAAYYLLEVKRDIKPLDAVARFHLGNGARVERLNWMADMSAHGLRQSWGVMVNYLYNPSALEDNIEAFAGGLIDASSAVKKMAAQVKII